MNKQFFALVILISLAVLGVVTIKEYRELHDGKLHVVFCDVGQGDGVIIKSPQGKILLYDGGPDEKFGACLSKFVPFWKRTIDMMMVSHPHTDHYVGSMTVLEKYQVKSFATEDLMSEQKAYELFLSLLSDKKVTKNILHQDNSLSIGRLQLKIVGPSKGFLQRTSPNGTIGESREFGSLEVFVEYGDFRMLLTGDSQASEIEEAVKTYSFSGISVLQTPHHGSATGLTEELIKRLHPKLAIISVGEKNRYGHPAPSILSLYAANKVPTKRTDKDGTIEIITDGRGFSVK